MLWTIILIITMFACLYGLGYCTAKLDSLKKFKKAMDKIHADDFMSSITPMFLGVVGS